jgi:hypothetical protein
VISRILPAAVPLLLFAHCASGAIAVDATVSSDQTTASTTVTSSSFSTGAGQELLLAFISTDYLTGNNTTVQSVSGAGVTWALVLRTNVQSGSSEIWRAFAPSALSGITVTATLSQKVQSSMTVMSFSGVDSSGTNGSGAIGAVASGNARTGAPAASLLTTRNGSWVFGVGNDFDNAIARTPASGQKLVHQDLTSAGDTYWVQMQTNPTPASGTSVGISDTAPKADRYNLSICEILPSADVTQTWIVSGAISAASMGAGATVSLSGAASAQTTADSGGNYSFSGLSNGSYTVTPAKAGLIFTPASQPVTISGTNQNGINFTAQTAPTWNISGAITPAAAASGTSVMLSGAANAVTTPNGSGTYSFSGLGNGNYTVTPTNSQYRFTPPSQAVTLSNANATGINFTAGTQTSGVAIDARVSADQMTASATIVSPVFSTAASQELLLALISTDYLSGANSTVQSVSGAGLTWTLVLRTDIQRGSSEIWRAFAPTGLNNVTVTATLSQKVQSSMTVMSFSGVDPSGAIGAVGSGNGSSGAPNASLITTRNNSWVIGVGNDFDNAIARTPGAGQTIVHQDLTSAGDTYWVQMQTGPAPVSGTSVSISDTAPTTDRYNLSICEILPATGNIQPAPPTVTMTSPAAGTIASLSTVSASVTDNVGISGVQFLLDGAPLGSQLTSPPYSIVWDTTTTTTGTHMVAARAQDNAGQTTVSAAVTVNVDNSGNPAVVGSWSSRVSLPAVAVNLILLPNNKVLFYQDGSTPTVWDYSANTFTNVPVSPDLFCSGAALLADGRVFVAGGFGTSDIGIANAEIFNPTTNNWTAVPNMAYKRWYPNVTTLSDGRMLVTAGWQTTAHTNAGISEIYNPATNSWTSLTNANNPFETYPFLYQLSDGRVIHIGGSEYATDTDVLDLTSQSWTVVDSRIIDGGSATMYLPEHFMKAGAAADSQDTGPGSSTTFVLDMTQANPAWQQTASMAYVRSFMNVTMLPDGTVLATGGETDKNGGNIANAVYAAELWSPQTQTWSTMASMHTPREYHGTALLLPDGRVLESGMGADFGNVPDEKSAEFYSPPYLFKGARPTITQAPTQIQYGANFFVGTPDAASIASVIMIRTGAVTHFFDQNERYVPLSFQQTTGGLTVAAPANANLAPPGSYMLFIVNSSGVPSIAPFLALPVN